MCFKQGWAQIKSRFDLIWRHFREALIWFDLIDFSGALIWFDLNFWTKIQIKSNKNRFFAWHFFRPRFILLKELLTKMNVSRKVTLRNAVFWNNFFFMGKKWPNQKLIWFSWFEKSNQIKSRFDLILCLFSGGVIWFDLIIFAWERDLVWFDLNLVDLCRSCKNWTRWVKSIGENPCINIFQKWGQEVVLVGASAPTKTTDCPKSF